MKASLCTLFLTVALFLSCGKSQNAVTVLKTFENDDYSEIVNILGPPADKTGYTIEHAPTKGWNHSALFSLYPKNPENKDVQIMEVIWSDGDYNILMCFHLVSGNNRCIIAKRIHKDVRF